MKLFLALLSLFACIIVGNAAVSQCYACVEEALADCDTKQFMFDCSNQTFLNIGSTHCYTAMGWYLDNSTWKNRVVRGCANCTSDMEARQGLENAFQNNVNWTLTELSCCNTDNCNNQTLTPTTTATTVMTSTTGPSMESKTQLPTESHASHLFPFNGILTFAVIVIGAILF